MLCTINGDTFYLLMKNTWNGDSRASCHIMNDNTNLFDVIGINELIQGGDMLGSFASMSNKLMVRHGSTLYGW